MFEQESGGRKLNHAGNLFMRQHFRSKPKTPGSNCFEKLELEIAKDNQDAASFNWRFSPGILETVEWINWKNVQWKLN